MSALRRKRLREDASQERRRPQRFRCDRLRIALAYFLSGVLPGSAVLAFAAASLADFFLALACFIAGALPGSAVFAFAAASLAGFLTFVDLAAGALPGSAVLALAGSPCCAMAAPDITSSATAAVTNFFIEASSSLKPRPRFSQ